MEKSLRDMLDNVIPEIPKRLFIDLSYAFGIQEFLLNVLNSKGQDSRTYNL